MLLTVWKFLTLGLRIIIYCIYTATRCNKKIVLHVKRKMNVEINATVVANAEGFSADKDCRVGTKEYSSGQEPMGFKAEDMEDPTEDVHPKATAENDAANLSEKVYKDSLLALKQNVARRRSTRVWEARSKWTGRRKSLEDASEHPSVDPSADHSVEMDVESHEGSLNSDLKSSVQEEPNIPVSTARVGDDDMNNQLRADHRFHRRVDNPVDRQEFDDVESQRQAGPSSRRSDQLVQTPPSPTGDSYTGGTPILEASVVHDNGRDAGENSHAAEWRNGWLFCAIALLVVCIAVAAAVAVLLVLVLESNSNSNSNSTEPPESGNDPIVYEGSNFCGATWVHAAKQCSKPCPTGKDFECDNGELCFANVDNCQTSPSNSITSSSDVVQPESSGVVSNPQATGPVGFYCGVDWVDASNCNNPACPSGLDGGCPAGLKCFSDLGHCDNVSETANFTSLSNATATQLTQVMAYDSKFCGSDWLDAATKCSTPCPGGVDGECPGNLKCFGDIDSCGSSMSANEAPSEGNGTKYCGLDWLDATNCLQPCPRGLDEECQSNLKCFADITSCNSDPRGTTLSSVFSQPGALPNHEDQMPSPTNGNFCGKDWAEASSCRHGACPGGLDGECVDNLKCFGGIEACLQPGVPGAALSNSTGRQCGVDWTDASSCSHGPCPGGLDSECAGNLKCFGGVEECTEPVGSDVAPNNSSGRHCGVDWTDASSCGRGACPGGLDSECAGNLKCFGGVEVCTESVALSNSSGRYCGVDWTDASSCGQGACPGGLDSECAGNLKCFGGVEACAEAVGLGLAPSSSSGRQCGVDWTDASSCGHGACPGGLDSECSGNLKCFGGVEVCTEPVAPGGSSGRQCGVDWSDASSCGHGSCPGGLDSECAGNLKCFGGVEVCTEPVVPGSSSGRYCGVDWTDASSCGHGACPGALDSECAGNLKCFGGVELCTEPVAPGSSSGRHCGVDWTDASSCGQGACPGGLDSECVGNLKCFGGVESCPFSFGPGVAPSSSSGNPGPGVAPSSSSGRQCGVDWMDASSCSHGACPGGLDGECVGNLKCFGGVESCAVAVGSGVAPSSSSGNPGSGVAPSSFSGRYCGVDWTDASSCGHGACPGGLDSECAGNLKCFGGVEGCTKPSGPGVAPSSSSVTPGPVAATSTNGSSRRQSGVDWMDASSCSHGACPGGLDGECVGNLKCFGGVEVCMVSVAPAVSPSSSSVTPGPAASPSISAGRHCGLDWADASRCGHGACPRGLDSECVGNLKCFGGVEVCIVSVAPAVAPSISSFSPGPAAASSSSAGRHCGMDWTDASSCGHGACPGGQDSKCFGTLKCFGGVEVCTASGGPTGATSNSSGRYCGVDWTDASSCGHGACPGGLDSECVGSLKCFGGVEACTRPAPSPTPTNNSPSPALNGAVEPTTVHSLCRFTIINRIFVIGFVSNAISMDDTEWAEIFQSAYETLSSSICFS